MNFSIDYFSTIDPILDDVRPPNPAQSLGISEQAHGRYGSHPVLEAPASDIPHTVDSSPEPHANQLQNAQYLGDIQLVPATPPVPATSMEPPTKRRKRKAPTLRAEAWEPYKARILELHIEEGRSLLEVKDTIESEFNFKAEVRQYRTRISHWGKDKNIKPQEMKAIVRKRQQRVLIESNRGRLAFTVRGNEVEPPKIDRWMKRHEIPKDLPYAPSPAISTPSAVGCWTISERNSPVPSQTYSAPSPAPSTRGATQSSHLSSPALSVSSILRPPPRRFTGQSPAPIHRVLPNSLDASIRTPITFAGQVGSVQPYLGRHKTGIQTGEPPTGFFQFRYRQSDEECMRQELSTLEILKGNDHPETLRVVQNLGELLKNQGRLKSAEKMIRRLVEARQRRHDDVKTIDALHSLGELRRFQGLYSEAERIYQRTFKFRKAMLGYEHSDTLESMASLALIYREQGRWNEAEELLEQVKETSTRVLGAENYFTLKYLVDLTSIYRIQNRLKEAEELGIQLVETGVRVLGKEHLLTLGTMAFLAFTYHRQERQKEAEVLLVQVIETCTRVLGGEHPDTLSCTYNLALIWKSQNHDKKALELLMEVVQVRKRVSGLDHPETIKSIKLLDSWSRES